MRTPTVASCSWCKASIIVVFALIHPRMDYPVPRATVSIMWFLCAAAHITIPALAGAETCDNLREQLFSLGGIEYCDAETYAGRASECIELQTNRLKVLVFLQQANCPSAPSKFTWTDRIESTTYLIAQMKKYPNGVFDRLDQAEAIRKGEADRLDPPKKPLSKTNR